jgi:hypothetical protein
MLQQRFHAGFAFVFHHRPMLKSFSILGHVSGFLIKFVVDNSHNHGFEFSVKIGFVHGLGFGLAFHGLESKIFISGSTT